MFSTLRFHLLSIQTFFSCNNKNIKEYEKKKNLVFISVSLLRPVETPFSFFRFQTSVSLKLTSSVSGHAKTFLFCYPGSLYKFAVPVSLRYVQFTFIFQNKCLSAQISIEIIIKIISIYATRFVSVCFCIIGGNDFIQ